MTEIVRNGLLTPEELQSKIDRLPRVELAALPTPIEECPRLSEALKGPSIFMKRDDLTGLAFGGNKTRQLEYLFGDVVQKGSDVVVTGAGTQSNFCRQTAAAAKKLGIDIVLHLIPGAKGSEPQGNMLIFHILGAEVKIVEGARGVEDAYMLDGIFRDTAAKLKGQGRNPYVMNVVGESTALAAVGYVNCVLELQKQMQKEDLKVDYLFLSSANVTQAGLELGAKAIGMDAHIVGIAPIRWEEERSVDIANIANNTAKLLQIDISLSPHEITNYDDYVGERYGAVTPESLEAIRLVARTEGILLDPVYTGKAMAGLSDCIQKGNIPNDATVMFLHTGGTPALFAYQREIMV